MARNARSDAAKKGWVTRRENERRRKQQRRERSERARVAWRVRRGDIDGVRLPVYNAEHITPRLPLGYARSELEASEIAEASAFPDVVDDVWVDDAPPRVSPRKAYYVRFGRISESDLLDDMPSDEWEIGFEYRGVSGRDSHVDVNVRIARDDGAEFGGREAAAVLRQFRRNLGRDNPNPVPTGYRMAFIDWRRPRWGSHWQSGETQDIAAFRAPMYAESDNPGAWTVTQSGDTRMGSVRKI